MSAAHNNGKARRYQVYPKHSRDIDAVDVSSSKKSGGSGNVFARAKDRDRRTPTRTTSWRYHPRSRGLVRPQSENVVGAAAVASAAAAVPPSWLKSNNGADLLLLAAGVRGGSGAARTRSLSDSTAVVCSSASSSSRSTASLAREAHRQQQHGNLEGDHEEEKDHHENLHVPPPHDEESRGLVVARGIPAAVESFDTQESEEGGDGDETTEEEGEGWRSSYSKSTVFLRERQPAAPAPTTPKDEKIARLFLSWLRFGSRRRTRLRDEKSPACSRQDPPVTVSSQPGSPAVAAPLLPSKAERCVRSTVRSSFRRGRTSSITGAKISRGKLGGKAVVAAAALACGATFAPVQGEHTSRVQQDVACEKSLG